MNVGLHPDPCVLHVYVGIGFSTASCADGDDDDDGAAFVGCSPIQVRGRYSAPDSEDSEGEEAMQQPQKRRKKVNQGDGQAHLQLCVPHMFCRVGQA